jgi:heat-inducible transcriptional repressor
MKHKSLKFNERLDVEARQQEILKAIVQDYIATALPVGSRAIVRRHGLKMSAATVRNVMADLADLGLITQPHASAGRVPTDLGYRFYVDCLLTTQEPTPQERELIGGQPEEASLTALLTGSSRILSGLTQHVGMVTAPFLGDPVLKYIEFVPLGGRRILAILVSRSNDVQNRVFRLDQDLSERELQKVSRYLNDKLQGLTLREIHDHAARELRSTQDIYYRLLMEAVRQDDLSSNDAAKLLFVEGSSSMLELPEFEDIDRARELLRALEERRTLLTVLDVVMEAEGVQVFIGAETELGGKLDCSVVAVNYGVEGHALGAIGVIGPRRMDYSRIIPLVHYTSQVVERKLRTV